MKRCSILAIGNEILRGEIVDRNSTSIGASLRDLGFDVVRRASVGDNIEEILAALDFASATSDIVLTTGGLGPTSDDLTRHAIAQWSKRELEFDDNAWQKIVDMLNQRGVPVAETNRRQAYFPSGSIIWRNNAGTADAFQVAAQQKQVIALPGPPSEIDVIWREIGEKYFRSQIPAADRLHLRSWHTVGQSESALAGIVESIIRANVDVAYQSSPPFVHIKLFLTESQTASLAPQIALLNAALEQFSIYQNGKDNLPVWCQALGAVPTLFLDSVTDGYAAGRLQPFLTHSALTIVNQRIANQPLVGDQLDLAAWQKAASADRVYIIDNLTPEGQFRVTCVAKGKTQHQTLRSPLKNPKLLHRNRMIAFELAVKHWIGLTS